MALFVGSVIANLGPKVADTKLNSAYNEIFNITTQIQRVRTYLGNYNLLTSFQFLTLRGYLEGYTTGVNENEFGLTMTAARASNTRGVYFQYQTPTIQQCLNLLDRTISLPNKKGVSNCTGHELATLSVLVD